jgi:hypothetical protein
LRKRPARSCWLCGTPLIAWRPGGLRRALERWAVGPARGALLLAPHPNDDARRILAVPKSNLEAVLTTLVDAITASDAAGFLRHCAYAVQ